jgi:ornithine cyclodeaminase/alanine dehydrogenase-like protein (mu-crystallin family)
LRTGISQLIKAIIAPSPLRKPFSNNFIFPLLPYRRTQDLPNKLKQADIVVTAVGIAQMIQGEWIKQGAIVIDVGINRLDNGSLVGDVDFVAN